MTTFISQKEKAAIDYYADFVRGIYPECKATVIEKTHYLFKK